METLKLVRRLARALPSLHFAAACLAVTQSGAPPGSCVVTQIATNATANAINNFGQVVGISGGSAFLWTPVSANGTAGSLSDFGGWPVVSACFSGVSIKAAPSWGIGGHTLTCGHQTRRMAPPELKRRSPCPWVFSPCGHTR
ncbi:exported hypothetical protein [Candidatus Sulfopaludibacter sp. SbA4]|nr:exported hypothetical protein [Candidatus Sulfopaludibacter sp. SbA4]